MTTIRVKGLTKTYPRQARPALADVDLEVPSGRITALLGPSGCGKTTLLKIIAGLLEPDRGAVDFDGSSMLAVAPEKRDAPLVFQNHLLFPHMTVAANVGFGLRMRRLEPAQIATKVAAALAQVKLAELAERMPAELSGGQQQRVALARALVVDPRVLLLDEPLSNLDAHLRDEMRELIGSLQRDAKVTCVFVTHDQQEAVEVADQIALLAAGEILQSGPARDFYERPANTAVAGFFGARNLLACTRKGASFSCALGDYALDHDCGQGAGFVTIRPENIGLSAEPIAGGLAATVIAADYLGVTSRFRVQAAGGDIELVVIGEASQHDLFVPGQRVHLALAPEKFWVMAS